jgi:DNA helicase-2/ATP-dependent DNA helicase PcrA
MSKAKQIVVKVYPLYREYMLRHNCLDFDDLIYYSRDLLLHHVDVRERLQRKWNHVLVDEFQDTSRSQLDLVKLWTSQSLMVVGDADQSIYSWRGAYTSSLSDFDKEFKAWGDVRTVFLMENYRSTSNIIRAAQKVISHRDNPDQTTGADRLRQNMKPTRGKGPNPRVMRFNDDEDEGTLSARSSLSTRYMQ